MKPAAHSNEVKDLIDEAQQRDQLATEFEDETRLMLSSLGVAWKLVERFILLWHSRPSWNTKISLLSRDDMVAMAENLVLLQQEWKLCSSSTTVDRRWNIDVAFHWTRLENLESIREGGLLTKVERDESGIRAHHNGSLYGDGVYTAR